MGKLILKDSFPFLFTLILGIIAYQYNFLISTINSSPTIEYYFNVRSSQNIENYVEEEMECYITNISNSKSFKKLSFGIAVNNNSNELVFDPFIVAVTPSPPLDDSNWKTISKRANIYTIPNLQPGLSYILRFKSRSSENEDEPYKIFLETDDTVKLVKKSFTTIMVKNQLLLNLVISLILLIVLFFYSFYLTKKKNNVTEN